MDEETLGQYEKNLDETIKKAEESFEIRQNTLDKIHQDLAILNQYLKVIVKEIQEMNQGIIITDDNKNP